MHQDPAHPTLNFVSTGGRDLIVCDTPKDKAPIIAWRFPAQCATKTGTTTELGLIVPIGLIAIGLGICATKKANEKPKEHGGKGFAIAGIALGSVTVVLTVIYR